MATYVSVPPIKFDLGAYMPGFLATAMQGMDLSDAMVATPMPPIPEQVESREYLVSLAERRQDDLVFAGVTTRSDPMRLAGETAEVARQYGELYSNLTPVSVATPPPPPVTMSSRFESMGQDEQLSELTSLTGRWLESIRAGQPDADIERQLQQLASAMPPKYRVEDLVEAIREPGGRGERLAELYLQRCYKLLNEDYLDLERIDREIEAAHG